MPDVILRLVVSQCTISVNLVYSVLLMLFSEDTRASEMAGCIYFVYESLSETASFPNARGTHPFIGIVARDIYHGTILGWHSGIPGIQCMLRIRLESNQRHIPGIKYHSFMARN